jgi:3-hydroxybutyrate dehydrogenase
MRSIWTHDLLTRPFLSTQEWSSFWHPNSKTDNDNTSHYATLEVNITHPIRATQLALDYFLRQPSKKGVVLCLSSIAAQVTVLPVPMYCASKHAISGFVRSLATLEPQMGIRIVAVAPGIVKTPIWAPKQAAWVDDTVDKWVTPQEVASAMVDLVEKEEFVGGTVLEIGAGGKRRRVETTGDPGPTGEGHTLAKMADGYGDAFGLLARNFGGEAKAA